MQNKKLPSFSSYVWLAASLTVAIAIFFSAYAWSEKQIDRANNQRYQTYQLVDELRRSSDELTRMARTYVTDGDPVYKVNYQAILDIRDGKRLRPEGYLNSDWDLALGGPNV